MVMQSADSSFLKMNIYVGNLSWNLKDQDLSNLFASHGEVASAKIVTDKFTNRSKGFGFVEMANDAEAQAAIAQLNGSEIEGRNLVVNESRPKQEGGSGGGGGFKKRSFGSGGGGGGYKKGGSGGGGSTAAQPSAGCGKAGPMTGSGSSPLMVSGHQYYVKLPSAYDANKPYRVIFVFNPTNNPITWAEQSAGFEQNAAKDQAIRVYPHPANSSSGWGAGDVSFFRPLYDSIVANFCVDKARVFATGESSGGDFSSILGCEHANVLRGVAPCATKNVSQYPLTAATRKCTGEVASIVIHGKNDNVVGPENGPKTRDFYAAVNHCTSMTMPVQGYTDAMSNCVQFQGCDAGFPVYWCQHTDPNYSGTNHGWPKFAPAMIWSTFSAY